MSFPTRNRDADREILKKMDDHAFLSVCTAVLNKSKDDYLEKLCNGDKYYPNLFEMRLRTDPKYIGTYAYKPTDMSWRKYFAHVIFWFEKLKSIGYNFTGNRGDPKKYYEILINGDLKDRYNMKQITRAIESGYIDLVTHLTRNVIPDLNGMLNYYLDTALIRQQIEIAKYFFAKGAIIRERIIEILLDTCNKEALDFILTTGDFDYARYFQYLRTKLTNLRYDFPTDVVRKTQHYTNMIDYLNAKFKLTLPVLPKFILKK